MPNLGEKPTRFSPIRIDLIQLSKGNTGIAISHISNSVGNGTTNLALTTTKNWGFFGDTAYWVVTWGHSNTSSAAGNMKAQLYDFTNASVLYTFSSNSSVANNTDVSTALTTTVIFTKPNGYAKIGMVARSADTTARNFAVWEACILLM